MKNREHLHSVSTRIYEAVEDILREELGRTLHEYEADQVEKDLHGMLERMFPGLEYNMGS